ncbi:MAG: helix-turn-helix transcriptional regulator [Bryobacteraceae bacterium]
MNPAKSAFGRRLRYIRKLRGASQRDIMRVCGFSSPTIVSEWENGKGDPLMRHIIAISEYFSINPACLAYGSDEYDMAIGEWERTMLAAVRHLGDEDRAKLQRHMQNYYTWPTILPLEGQPDDSVIDAQLSASEVARRVAARTKRASTPASAELHALCTRIAEWLEDPSSGITASDVNAFERVYALVHERFEPKEPGATEGSPSSGGPDVGTGKAHGS